MRHLSLSLIVAALVLAACDMNKPKVQRTSSAQESINTTTVAPVVAPAATPVVTPAAKPPVVRKANITTQFEPEVREDSLSDGALVEEDIYIQAEEEPINARSDDRKTYNEKQVSDDESDYPIERSEGGETYNETQRSEEFKAPEELVDVIVAVSAKGKIGKIFGGYTKTGVERIPDPHIGYGSTQRLKFNVISWTIKNSIPIICDIFSNTSNIRIFK